MTTLKDIAKVCGVAPITVSDILNNKPGAASALTRERVLQTAQAMDYRPNTVARGLRQGRLNTVGVLLRQSGTPMMSNPVGMMLLDSILSVNTRRRQNTTIVTVEEWPDDTGQIRHSALSTCDGVLLAVPPDADALRPLFERRRLPFVSIAAKSERDDVSVVDVDNLAAVGAAVRHLAERGHRRIAFLCEPGLAFQFVRERLQGYRAAVSELALESDPGWEMIGPDCFSVLSALFRSDPAERPTALFCATDFCAVTALTVLSSECGLRVPDDLSLIGYDDIPITAMLRPALTTIHQPLGEIGAAATDLLLDMIDGKEPPGRKILLPATLVERQSVSAPPR